MSKKEKPEPSAGPSLEGMIAGAVILVVGPLVMIQTHSRGNVIGGLVIWALALVVGAYAIGDVLACRRVHAYYARKDQHKQDAVVPVSAQRNRNREWIKHARHEGATEVVIWFADDEFAEAEQITVPITQALATLAKHTKDAHLDAVGVAGGHHLGLYLTEWDGADA